MAGLWRDARQLFRRANVSLQHFHLPYFWRMSHLHGSWEDLAQPCLSGGSIVNPCPLPLTWQADIPASLGEDMKMSSTSLNVLIAC